MINIAMFLLLLGLLAWGITMTVLYFTCDCKQNNPEQPQEMNDAVLSMPNCSDTATWAKCMEGEGEVKHCVKMNTGVMPDGNKEEGCWVKDDKHDPCLYFMEGGPSPNMAPKKCGSVCCSGGYYIKNDKKTSE